MTGSRLPKVEGEPDLDGGSIRSVNGSRPVTGNLVPVSVPKLFVVAHLLVVMVQRHTMSLEFAGGLAALDLERTT